MNRLALCLLALFAVSACGPTAPKCNTTNCTGCCDAMTDTCRAGTEAAACGVAGTLCIACPGAQVCRSDRTCGAAPMDTTRCSASNCDGCCDDAGACQRGQSTAVCGSGGNTCGNCGSMRCEPTSAGSQFGGSCR